jgi:hypothetical protein
MKRHAEPLRTAPRCCAGCGLPYDLTEAARLMDLVPATVRGWTLCERCGEPTHPELRRVIAEEAERQEAGESG